MPAAKNTDKSTAKSSAKSSTKKAPVDTALVREKFEALNLVLNNRLCKREDQIYLMFIALLTRNSMFLAGKSGVGKSYMVTEVMKCFKVKHVKKVLNAETEYDSVFGVPKFQDGALTRNLEGTPALAHTVFMDEIGKTNASFRSSLLPFFNEKEIENGTKVIPLKHFISGFAASNEQTNEVIGFINRFFLKTVVNPLKHKDLIEYAKRKNRGDIKEIDPKYFITLSELIACQKAVSQVTLPDSMIDAMGMILHHIKDSDQRKKLYIDDRKFLASLEIVKAAAWFSGQSPRWEHLKVLENCWWDSPSDRVKVGQLIDESIIENSSRLRSTVFK